MKIAMICGLKYKRISKGNHRALKPLDNIIEI